jgi:hypothetical protein
VNTPSITQQWKCTALRQFGLRAPQQPLGDRLEHLGPDLRIGLLTLRQHLRHRHRALEVLGDYGGQDHGQRRRQLGHLQGTVGDSAHARPVHGREPPAPASLAAHFLPRSHPSPPRL